MANVNWEGEVIFHFSFSIFHFSFDHWSSVLSERVKLMWSCVKGDGAEGRVTRVAQ